MTKFQEIYDRFLGKMTDDMYFENGGIAEWTKDDTLNDLKQILLDAIPGFEFPRFSLYDYDEPTETYNCDLTSEEINIFALLMYNTWLQRQIASVENIRMKYSGTDFKLSSQANHLAKLIVLKQEAERQTHHMQRLYRRRKTTAAGSIASNWSSIMEKSALE